MKRIACLALALILLMSATALADSKLKLMQARQLEGSKDVRLYVSAQEPPTQDNLSVFLNNRQVDLPRTIDTVAETGEGTVYVFCMDVSGTISTADLDRVCDEIIEFSGTLGPNDLMRIYVIGTGAEPLCDYTNSREEVERVLSTIPRRTQKTFLWNGVQMAADDLHANRGHLPELAQIIVFTDGVDDSDNAVTVEDTLASVQNAGVPLRVVEMKSSERNADRSSLEWLCEESGGVIFDGKNNLDAGIDALHPLMNG